MAHQVNWNIYVLEEFIRVGCLTDIEEHVIRLRMAGKTIDQQADILGLSKSSINKITARLKIKYDNAAKISAILPPRKFSALETYKSED